MEQCHKNVGQRILVWAELGADGKYNSSQNRDSPTSRIEYLEPVPAGHPTAVEHGRLAGRTPGVEPGKGREREGGRRERGGGRRERERGGGSCQGAATSEMAGKMEEGQRTHFQMSSMAPGVELRLTERYLYTPAHTHTHTHRHRHHHHTHTRIHSRRRPREPSCTAKRE